MKRLYTVPDLKDPVTETKYEIKNRVCITSLDHRGLHGCSSQSRIDMTTQYFQAIMSSWVAFTLLAALMQSVRTAGQKSLSGKISPMSATLVRYVYGAPFALLYLFILAGDSSTSYLLHALQLPRFVLYASMAAVAQILATCLLIMLFRFRNFTVGTSFAKSEALLAAVFGTVFFASPLTAIQWIAVLLGAISMIIVSLPAHQPTLNHTQQQSSHQKLNPVTLLIGLSSGALFGLTSLWLREASLSLGTAINIHGIESAAVTLTLMVLFQSVCCLIYTCIRERSELAKIIRHSKLAVFVGFTSALGSAGWFTAMTLQNAAVVKSVGQIEFIFTLLLTVFLFKERVSGRELLGVAGIVGSVLLLLSG